MKKRNLAAIIISFILLLALPGIVWGQEVRQNITSITEDIVIQQGERVYGNVTSVSGRIILFGEVRGNITTATGDIELKNSSVVRGNVTSGTGSILREPGAAVMGTVFRGTNMPRFEFDQLTHARTRAADPWTHIFDRFTTMLGILAVIVILISVLPLNVQKMMAALKMEPGRVVLVGILGWVLLPFLMLVSLITLIGPVLLAVAAMGAFLAGIGIIGLLIGEKMVTLFKWQNDNKILAAAVGLAALWAASLLPLVSIIIYLVSAIIGMGVVLITRFGTNRPWFPPRSTNKKGDIEDEDQPKI